MGVEKAWPREGNPKNIFWTLPKLQKCPNQFGKGATPKLGNAQKKGCLFLGFLPSYYMSTVSHCSSSSPQNLALNIRVGKLHRMVGPTQNLILYVWVRRSHRSGQTTEDTGDFFSSVEQNLGRPLTAATIH